MRALSYENLYSRFIMCQSMFCSIPAPQLWDEKAKDKMLLFLPIVGLEMGAIWTALAWLCTFAHLPSLVTGLILMFIPAVSRCWKRLQISGKTPASSPTGSQPREWGML